MIILLHVILDFLVFRTIYLKYIFIYMYICSGIPSRLYLIPSANPDVVRYVFRQEKGRRRMGGRGGRQVLIPPAHQIK